MSSGSAQTIPVPLPPRCRYARSAKPLFNLSELKTSRIWPGAFVLRDQPLGTLVFQASHHFRTFSELSYHVGGKALDDSICHRVYRFVIDWRFSVVPSRRACLFTILLSINMGSAGEIVIMGMDATFSIVAL